MATKIIKDDLDDLLKLIDGEISSTAKPGYRPTDEGGFTTAKGHTITPEELKKVFESMTEAAKDEDVKKATSRVITQEGFAASQKKLEKKYPEAAERVRLFKNYLKEKVLFKPAGYLVSEDSETDNKTYFTLDSPKNLPVMNLEIKTFESESVLGDIYKQVVAASFDGEYSKLIGTYRNLPFIGDEPLRPIDAYIGANGKVIFRFIELLAEGKIRTTTSTQIVELKEGATEILEGFDTFYEEVLSVSETISSEKEFKELMNIIKLNNSEEQGSW